MFQVDLSLIWQCPCGQRESIETEAIVVAHMKQCQQIQSKSQVRELLKNHQNLDTQDAVVFKADLKALIDKVNEELLNQNSNDCEDVQEPPQLKLKSRISNYSKDDTYFYVPHQQNLSPVQCTCCQRIYDSSIDIQSLWYLENCCHLICKRCLTKLVNAEYLLKDGSINCSEQICDQKISNVDITNVMGQEKFNELDYKLMLKSLNLISCIKCKLQFGFEKGDDNSAVKDPKTHLQLEGKLLQHYTENRFTCPSHECRTEQCQNCFTTPYHIGYDCDQYKLVQKSTKCRFCESTIDDVVDDSKEKALQNVCVQLDCVQRSKQICLKVHECGHCCSGYKDELCCLPCLEEECNIPDDQLQQNADDYCNICFTESLKSSPCVRAKCGHVYHQECITKRIETKWNGPRIVFNFCLCPLCKKWLEFPLDHKGLTRLMSQFKRLFDDVRVHIFFDYKIKVMDRLKLDKRENDKELIDPNHPYYQKPLDYGMAIFAYYECYKCKRPYFGGLKSCQLNIQDEAKQFDRTELICVQCCPISFEEDCKKHGKEHIEFKCRFCCSLATWFCWGTTHFCDPCHNKATELSEKPIQELLQCTSVQTCPLRIKHKPNGEECALACGECREEKIILDSGYVIPAAERK